MKFHRTAPWQDGDPLHSHLNEESFDLWVNPDGLRPWSINFLLADVYREIRDEPVPTSALLDGSAVEARLERMTNRAIAALRSVPTACDGQEALHASAA
jgi:hypothetical protein